jgi:mannose-1-phosphate guanylyltransferase
MQRLTGSNTLAIEKGFGEVRAMLLAAGLGTRLRPFSIDWPKCLMPIQRRALLEIWLDQLQQLGIDAAAVNLHYHHEQVRQFLDREKYRSWVSGVFEEKLLGTAGTLRYNSAFLRGRTIFVAHADNLCLSNLESFFRYHFCERPVGTVITMMTFETKNPSSCGIVELDKDSVVQGFHEKSSHPPGNLANAAIYMMEPEVLEFIDQNPGIADLSTEVIPAFLGRIATWKSDGSLVDIGTPESLLCAQVQVSAFQEQQLILDDWQKLFMKNPIHQQLEEYWLSNSLI